MGVGARLLSCSFGVEIEAIAAVSV
jgi:hypothetical protein